MFINVKKYKLKIEVLRGLSAEGGGRGKKIKDA